MRAKRALQRRLMKHPFVTEDGKWSKGESQASVASFKLTSNLSVTFIGGYYTSRVTRMLHIILTHLVAQRHTRVTAQNPKVLFFSHYQATESMMRVHSRRGFLTSLCVRFIGCPNTGGPLRIPHSDSRCS
jgi:hypothetical protein